MMLYFKHEAETDLGEGAVYLEFDGNWVSRQVEVYGDKWFCSNKNYYTEIGLALCDQPLGELDLGSEHEISQSEFEAAWNEALKRNSLNL